MKTYILTYNLKAPEKDYTSLYSAIKDNCAEWHHFMESSWFIRTELSAKEYIEKIAPHFSNREYAYDSYFLIDIDDSNNREGFMATSAWKFLKGEEKEQKEKES